MTEEPEHAQPPKAGGAEPEPLAPPSIPPPADLPPAVADALKTLRGKSEVLEQRLQNLEGPMKEWKQKAKDAAASAALAKLTAAYPDIAAHPPLQMAVLGAHEATGADLHLLAHWVTTEFRKAVNTEVDRLVNAQKPAPPVAPGSGGTPPPTRPEIPSDVAKAVDLYLANAK